MDWQVGWGVSLIPLWPVQNPLKKVIFKSGMLIFLCWPPAMLTTVGIKLT